MGVILQAEEGGMQPRGHIVTCEWQRGRGARSSSLFSEQNLRQHAQLTSTSQTNPRALSTAEGPGRRSQDRRGCG